MKKALKLAIVYLVVLIVGTIIGTILYSFYLNLLGFVSGREIVFFKDSELFKSLFYVIPCMLIFILPVIAYYRIRHPGGALQLIVYIVLCALTWVLLMPGSFKLYDFCNRKFSFKTEREYLSPDYFRKAGDNVYYFTQEFSVSSLGRAVEAPAIIIDTTEEGGVEFRKVVDFPSSDLNRKAAPFREVQLKSIFGDGENPVSIDFRLLMSMISGAYSGGLSHILTLFSFVLLLCSVYAITNFFDWRLLNAIILYITTALILCFNSIYFMTFFDPIKTRLMTSGALKAFGKVVSEPLLFICNILLAIILITGGIVRFAVRRHAAKVR